MNSPVNIVEKRAIIRDGYLRPSVGFPNARSALKWILMRMNVPEEGGLLLPSYVGWSEKEGSGVFDPVRELRSPYGFYSMTRDLTIDLKDLATKVTNLRPRALLLIHYFGYPDPNYREAAEIARKANAFVIEDEAHALLSDLVGRACGRAGDASFFSIHKILPTKSGGLALFNDVSWAYKSSVNVNKMARGVKTTLAQYDLAQISYLRIRNATFLLDRLTSFSPYLKVLRPELPDGVVPQTLPVLLNKAPRNEIYLAMNQAGYGVASLYHTLIHEISAELFPDAHWISKRVLNLPVHQDVSLTALDSLLSHLAVLLSRWK